MTVHTIGDTPNSFSGSPSSESSITPFRIPSDALAVPGGLLRGFAFCLLYEAIGAIAIFGLLRIFRFLWQILTR